MRSVALLATLAAALTGCGGMIHIDYGDRDHDGVYGSDDCDDDDAARFPGAADVPDDAIDQDCDGVDATVGDTDPPDTDVDVHPGDTDGVDSDIPVNHAPLVTSCTLTPSDPDMGTALTAVAVVQDEDGDPIEVSYAWELVTAAGPQGVTVPLGETGPTLPSCDDRNVADGEPGFEANGYPGMLIAVTCTASDGATTRSATSPRVEIRPRAPDFDVTLSPAPATVAAPIVATTTFAERDPLPPGGAAPTYTLQYAWTVNGASVPGTTATLPVGAFARGDVVAVEVTATRPSLTLTATDTVFVGDTPSTLTGCTVAPTTDVVISTELTATASGIADADAGDVDHADVGYQWQIEKALAWVDLPTQGSSRTLSSCLDRNVPATEPGSLYNCQRGSRLRVVCTPRTATTTGTPVVSAPVTIGNAIPRVVEVRITFTPPSADPGLLAKVTLDDDDDEEVVALYRWLVDDVEVGTAATLAPGSFAYSDIVTLEVRAQDAFGDVSPPVRQSIVIGGADPDADHDGFPSAIDCDDGDPFVFPGAAEVCDGHRNDCDLTDWEPDVEAALVTYFGYDGGAYTAENIPFDGDVTLSDGEYRICGPHEVRITVPDDVNVTLSGPEGPGADATPTIVLAGGGAGTTLTVDGGYVEVYGLILADGVGVDGGDVAVTSGTLHLDQVVVRDGHASRGGGGFVDAGGVLKISRSTFEDNVADDEGGGLYVEGAVSGTASFDRNTATRGGGLAERYGDIDLGVSFTGNHADDAGGGAYLGGGAVEIGGFVLQNTADGNGGGLAVEAAPGFYLYNLSVRENVAGGDGGGVWMTIDGEVLPNDQHVFLRDVGFVDNTAAGDGGGLWMRGLDDDAWVALRGAFRGNAARRGGGLAQEGLGRLEIAIDSSVSENTATIEGAGIASSGARLTLDTTAVERNLLGVPGSGDTAYGAGVSLVGTVATLTGCVVRDNGAATSPTMSSAVVHGGGLAVRDGMVTLASTEVAGNTATLGGGVYAVHALDDALVLTGTGLVSGNTAAVGGGVWLGDGNLVCAPDAATDGAGFLDNVATTQGGGVLLAAGTATLDAQACDFGSGSNLAAGAPSDVAYGTIDLALPDDATTFCHGGTGCVPDVSITSP